MSAHHNAQCACGIKAHLGPADMRNLQGAPYRCRRCANRAASEVAAQARARAADDAVKGAARKARIMVIEARNAGLTPEQFCARIGMPYLPGAGWIFATAQAVGRA